MSGGLLREVNLRPGPAGRQGVPLDLDIQVVRPLTEADRGLLSAETTAVATVAKGPKSLRHSHHRLAEMIAKGLANEEIALATGYSPSYISGIKRDPAFADLIAFYEAQKQTIFVDALERLRVLGLDATEKLQEKLDDPAVDWTKRELMELVEMTVGRANSGKFAPAAPGAGASLSLEVKFVGAAQPQGEIVDVQCTEVSEVPSARSR